MRFSYEELSNSELHVLNLASIGLKNFYPWNLLEKNIGETKGLVEMLINLRDEIKNNKNKEYNFFKMDQNIYWRIQKVRFKLFGLFKFTEFQT